MLLPREEIYRERAFDELIKDEFTREIFNVISQNEDNLEWRFYSSEVTAEEQYAELFNMTYYFLTEAQMRPYPQLRIGEYEIYIEERANVYSYDSSFCKDYVFSIMYYLENEHSLIVNSAFRERLQLRSIEYYYNLFFRSMPIGKVWDWFIFMKFPIDDSNKKPLLEGQDLSVCRQSTAPFLIAPKKQTSVFVVLEAMYKAGWIRKVDGGKYRSRDEMINDVVQVLFNQNEAKGVKQKLNSAKNRTFDGRKKYFDELMKYITEDEQVIKE